MNVVCVSISSYRVQQTQHFIEADTNVQNQQEDKEEEKHEKLNGFQIVRWMTVKQANFNRNESMNLNHEELIFFWKLFDNSLKFWYLKVT